MEFLEELEKSTNTTYTENQALSNQSTLNPVLDFFALTGAMRNNYKDALDLFDKAYTTDRQSTVRALFYLRDIRGGQGERDLFRVILGRLFQLDAQTGNTVLKWIPEYGRWDDLPICDTTIQLIAQQLKLDEQDMSDEQSVSLMAKWLPSENASSEKTKKAARYIANALNMEPKEYRQRLVALRKYITLLEQDMSSNNWNINYSKVPSQALRKHTKAFNRHDAEGFAKYLEAVKSGEVKINTSTLYTYEVYGLCRKDPVTADVIWQNLPDYCDGRNALVMADVSGSMTWTGNKPEPIEVSVSLAVYFADRNTGPFKGCFLTFSQTPKLERVPDGTLAEKMAYLEASDGWGMNTNLQAAFDAILTAAVKSNATQDEIPAAIYIISDMQFDQATSRNDETNFQTAERKFKEAGYELPTVVFWNVAARGKEVPATKYDGKVTLISGNSQSTFRYAVEGKSPEESMNDILNSERYAQIVV